MTPFYLSIAVAILSSVLYHLFQKAISANVNPALSLIVTYLTALALCLPLLLLFPLGSSVREAARKLNWASFALGLAIVGLEVGFLLAYRAGWNVSLAGIATNSAGALVLLPAGVLLFRERPTLINLLGVLVCTLGLLMIHHQG